MNDSGWSTQTNKMLLKFTWHNDAYENIEWFNLIIRAYEPITNGTKVVTFTLILDNQGEVWFRVMSEDTCRDYTWRDSLLLSHDKVNNGTSLTIYFP